MAKMNSGPTPMSAMTIWISCPKRVTALPKGMTQRVMKAGAAVKAGAIQ